MRRLLTLFIIAFATFGITTAQETPNSWSVWVYDATLGQAVQVDNLGAVLEQVTLPIPAPYISYSLAPNLAVSPNGERIAYHVSGTDEADQQISTFIVYDTSTERILFSFNTPEYASASSLTFSSVAWNSTGNIVVYGYATGDTLETQSWELIAFNAFDGRRISDQSPESTYFQSLPDSLAPYLLPVIQIADEASFGFNLVPYQTLDFGLDLPSYQWDIVTGRMIRTNRTPRLTGDIFSITGEGITPTIDDRVNYDEQYAPYTNALHVYRPEVGARAPFYATTAYDIQRAHFSQNGEQVTALAQDLLTLNFVRLQINRIGISQVLPNINPIDNVTLGTPTGFAYMIDNETPFLINVDTRVSEFPQTPIWSAPQGSRFVPVWVSTLAQDEYDAWLQLAPPVFEAQVVINNESSTGIDPNDVSPVAPITTTGGIITVNTVAIISTTGGDRLNMRDQVGLSSNVIARLDSGTRVVVIDGPVAQDGFTWWEIRLSTGQTGWVVERADGVQTLIPTS